MIVSLGNLTVITLAICRYPLPDFTPECMRFKQASPKSTPSIEVQVEASMYFLCYNGGNKEVMKSRRWGENSIYYDNLVTKPMRGSSNLMK